VSSSRSVIAAIFRECNAADGQMRPIIHARLTTDAIPGSIAAMPVTPERARTLGKLWAFPDGTIEAAYDGRALEILIHPEDWHGLLKELPSENGYAVQNAIWCGEPDRVLGIPVSRA
jgi:hypothetical protein